MLLASLVKAQTEPKDYRCGMPYPPVNGAIDGCSRGHMVGSRCKLACLPGFTYMPREHQCVCTENPVGEALCFWAGEMPDCQPLVCKQIEPDFSGGRLTIIEQWRTGFSGIIEFPKIPNEIVISEGWTILLSFSYQLGSEVSIYSWTSETNPQLNNGRSFTLHNTPENGNLQGAGFLRTVVVMEGIQWGVPTEAYVGLYTRRIPDVSCMMRSDNLPNVVYLANNQKCAEAPSPVTTTTKTTTTIKPTTEKSTMKTTTAVEMPLTTTTTEETAVSTTTPLSTTTSEEETAEASEEEVDAEAEESEETSTSPEEEEEKVSSTEKPTEEPPLFQKIKGRFCFRQPSDSYKNQKGWVSRGTGHFSGNAIIDSNDQYNDWLIAIVFESPVMDMEVWNAQNVKSGDDHVWVFEGLPWNKVMHSGKFDLGFNAKFDAGGAPEVAPLEGILVFESVQRRRCYP